MIQAKLRDLESQMNFHYFKIVYVMQVKNRSSRVKFQISILNYFLLMKVPVSQLVSTGDKIVSQVDMWLNREWLRDGWARQQEKSEIDSS